MGTAYLSLGSNIAPARNLSRAISALRERFGGVQVSPVIEVDHRPVGSGEIGPIARLVRDRYFDAVRGRLPEYQHWLTPID